MFESTLTTFASRYDLDKSVRRLRLGATSTHVVTTARVLVRRRLPARSDFAPAFEGRFSEAGGTVTLSGHFGLQLRVRIFLCGWFGFGALCPARTRGGAWPC